MDGSWRGTSFSRGIGTRCASRPSWQPWRGSWRVSGTETQAFSPANLDFSRILYINTGTGKILGTPVPLPVRIPRDAPAVSNTQPRYDPRQGAALLRAGPRRSYPRHPLP